MRLDKIPTEDYCQVLNLFKTGKLQELRLYLIDKGAISCSSTCNEPYIREWLHYYIRENLITCV